MTDRRDYQPLIEAVEKTIDAKVNGKLDRLNEKLDKHIDEDIRWKTKIVTKLEELRPVSDGLRAFKTIRGGAIYIAGFTTAVSAIVVGFAVAIKFLINTIK